MTNMEAITIQYDKRNRTVRKALEGWIEEGIIKLVNPTKPTPGGWTFATPDLPYNPATDNPSPSGDPWWNIAENRNEVARAIAAAHAPGAEFITLEQLKAELNLP